MEEKVYLDKLAKRDIKPTAIRLLILKSMMEAGRAVSQLDLETLLDTVDKSTISRDNYTFPVSSSDTQYR